ncbi:hypothetical protein [Pseudanabaena sp. PCC 6802]|uniref:hypothetical protein n=1 Tax=Pseudanabaena sp. PCC 6802 TaxID=118173 RepID=UPI000363B794|nr:hypothetical protein [Pseudanabaena sp. PCC 6802]
MSLIPIDIYLNIFNINLYFGAGSRQGFIWVIASSLVTNSPTSTTRIYAYFVSTIAVKTAIFLKTASLAAINDRRIWILIATCTWSRWGQLRAIAVYPYLKEWGHSIPG